MKDEIIYSGKSIFRVVKVEADEKYQLHLVFSNGEERLYNGKQLLGNDDVFAPLENLQLFIFYLLLLCLLLLYIGRFGNDLKRIIYLSSFCSESDTFLVQIG